MIDYQTIKYMNNFIQNYEIILNNLKGLDVNSNVFQQAGSQS